jgi:hypothetical protein
MIPEAFKKEGISKGTALLAVPNRDNTDKSAGRMRRIKVLLSSDV